MAHKFNNILATILLSADLLQNQLGKDNKQLRRMMRATLRGANLIQKLRAYSCQQQLSPRVLDLNAFVEGCPYRKSHPDPIRPDSEGCDMIWIDDRDTTLRLELPENITLLPLPPRMPELNPVENIWRFLRQNWLFNQFFKSYDDILM